MIRRRIVAVLSALIIIIPGMSFAVTVTFTADHTCKIGNNDSKNDARRFCFIEAKNKLLKKTGIYFINLTKEKNFELDVDEIIAFSTTLLNIETESEKWKYDKDELTLTLLIKTIVDSHSVKTDLYKIGKDLSLQVEMDENYKKLLELEMQYMDLHDELTNASPYEALILRKERQAIVEKMDAIEKMKFRVSSQSMLVSEKITPGMTAEDVINIAGKPVAAEKCRQPEFYNYGRIWVYFEDGVVSRLIPVSNWSGPCKNYDAENTDLQKLQISETGVDELQKEKPAESQKVSKKKKKNKFRLILKNGKIIETPLYYPIDDIIYYEQYGEIIGIEKNDIKKIKPIK